MYFLLGYMRQECNILGITALSYTYFAVSVRQSVSPSVCSRLTFYQKQLRYGAVIWLIRLLPVQIIGQLASLFF